MFKQFAIIATALLACPALTSAASVTPGFDASRIVFSHSGEMDFDGRPGDLEVSRFEIRSLLSKPITPLSDLTILPMLEYKGTQLDIGGVTPDFPLHDEDLHSIGLSIFAVSNHKNSPWIYGSWVRAEMASDFQDIGSDDFTFDLAGGAGYRFGEPFTLGFGAVLLDLNGDTKLFPGVGFDWRLNNSIRIALYGPTFVATYSLSENWLFSLRSESGGGIWNISDDSGTSRSIDHSSYHVGLFASRRLSGNLWLSAGAGTTLGNQIRLTEPNGDSLFKQDMDSGLFGQIGLRLKTW